jgi:hypothetical protein
MSTAATRVYVFLADLSHPIFSAPVRAGAWICVSVEAAELNGHICHGLDSLIRVE